ncbi:MAG TPA: phage terminase large subunit [Armatimonadota bacterium]|jgi:predicted phage terminase large subunit-like protein
MSWTASRPSPKGAPTNREVKAAKARRRFRHFVRQAWHVLEPDTPLQDNWHIDVLCDHLQAAVEGWARQKKDEDAENPLQNLVINIPPGTAKSRVVSVMWPAWVWLKWPQFRWAFLSANPRVAQRDAMYCKDLLESDWYRDTFGIAWELRDDANAASRFFNSAGGCRQALGIMSRITGDRSDALVVDDPHDAEEAQSDVKRQAVIDKWDSATANRVNDLRLSLRVGIMQRLHEDDWSGHVLAEGGWAHINLPMEYERPLKCQCPCCVKGGVTALGSYDRRTREGELLFHQRFTPAVLASELKRLGATGYAGQMQQRPSARGGTLFPVAKIEIVTALPAGIRLLRYWDKAGTEGGGCYTVGALLGEYEGIYYVADIVRGQWGSDNRKSVMKATAAMDGTEVQVWFEREQGSGGKESAEISIKDLAGYDVHEDLVTGDKETRARPFAAQVQAGNVRMLLGEWNKTYLGELETAPNGKYKDQWDASSGAFNKLALGAGESTAFNPLELITSMTRGRR